MMRIAKWSLLGLVFFVGSAAYANTVEYDISVDTTSILGTVGYLDFQFNPGPPSYAPATANLTNFGTDGTLDLTGSFTSGLFTQGEVTGDLPGPLTFVNDNAAAANEYSPGFRYGTGIRFDVSFSWTQPATAPDSPSSFLFWMYDSSFNPLLTTLGSSNPAGQALELDIDPDGSTSVSTFSPQVTVTQVATTVPEPSSLPVVIIGLGVIGCLRRRRC